MEDFVFEVSNLLTDEEAEKLFEDVDLKEAPQETKPAEEKEEVDPTEKTAESSEEVGTEEIVETEEDAEVTKSEGSSPTFYSSIASALKNDGIFPDFTDEELGAVNSAEDFAELLEKAIDAKLDDRMKRINSALNNGAAPDEVKMYEQTLDYLASIDEKALTAESEEGENLRKQLIYNDLINRGYSQEKAARELEKSFKSGSDIDDAKDALNALMTFYHNGYESMQKSYKEKADAAKKAQKDNAEKFRKMVLEDDVKLGDISLDKKTKQKVFDAVYKPVYKDPETGQYLTQVQKFQRENPMEFMKQLGMWYVLTNGGKDANGFMKEQVRIEKNKGIRELERKINSSAFDSDGSIRYISGNQIDNDSLLSDGWKVDLGR